MTMDGEMFLARVDRVFEGRVRIAKRGRVPNREIGTMRFEEERLVRARCMAIDDNRQRFDVEADCSGRVLGEGRVLRQHHRNRFSDIADLLMRKDRLMERDERGKRLEPDVDGRYR